METLFNIVSISPSDKTIIISGVVGIIPAVATFFITRFGYSQKYKHETSRLEHDIKLQRINIDKSTFEVYNTIISSFKNQIEEINAQKDALVKEIKTLREVIVSTKEHYHIEEN